MNTNPDGNLFDKTVIRMLMEVGPDGYLRWKPLDQNAWAQLREVYLRMEVSADRDRDTHMTEHGRRVYNGKRARRLVQVTTAGVVRLLRVIEISPFVIEKIFPGAKLGVTDATPKCGPAYPNTLLVELCRMGPGGLPVWRERSRATWQKLELFGFSDTVPTAKRIEAWNAANVGVEVPISAAANRAGRYRIGRRGVSLNRMRAALD